jgi:hypothetical protein
MIPASPTPRERRADDPNLPPWVLGRVDSLALAIYERAKSMGIPITQGTSMMQGQGGDFGGEAPAPAPPPQ